jgi:Tfp pilus assembly protein PilX
VTAQDLQALKRAAEDARAAARDAERDFRAALKEERKTRSLANIAAELGVTRGRVHQLTSRKDDDQ